MWRVASVLLLGCWHGPVPPSRGPEVALRRRVGVGAELVGCTFGHGVVTANERVVPTTMRHRWTEHVRAVAPDGALTLSLLHVTISSTMSPPGAEPLVSRASLDEGKPFAVDLRNRTAEPPPSHDDGPPPDRYAFDPLPQVEDLLDVPYPDAPLAAGDTFELHAHRVRREPNNVPVDRWLDVRFTVVRVVSGISLQLTCAGTERQSFTFPIARGNSRADLTCSVDLDLRDGRTARWRIDTSVTGEILETGTTDVHLSSKMHHDITLAPSGHEDAAVCHHATEPAPD